MESSTGSGDIRKTVIVAVIGNIMEWYDFALYGYFAPVLAHLFFPSEDPSSEWEVALDSRLMYES